MGVIKGGETFAARQINKAVLGGGKLRDWKQGTEGRQQDWNQLDVSYKKIKQSRKKNIEKDTGQEKCKWTGDKGEKDRQGEEELWGKDEW